MTTQTTQVEKAKPGELEAVLGWLEVPGESVPAPADPEIDGQAEQVVGHLLTVDPKDAETITRGRNTIQNHGRGAAARGGAPQRDAEAAGAEALRGRDRGRRRRATRCVDLQDEGRGARSRASSTSSRAGSRARSDACRSSARRSSATSRDTRARATQLDAIVRALRSGREQLTRDNITLDRRPEGDARAADRSSKRRSSSGS